MLLKLMMNLESRLNYELWYTDHDDECVQPCVTSGSVGHMYSQHGGFSAAKYELLITISQYLRHVRGR